MTDPAGPEAREAMRAQLAVMKRAVEVVRGMGQTTLNAYVATPEGRQHVVELQQQVSEWRQILATGVRELADADRMMLRALRKPWRIRA